MTKEAFAKVLDEAIGSSAYGKELISELTEHFDDSGKYAQNAKDRLDEKLGVLHEWIKKHIAAGDYKKAAIEAEKLAVVLNALAAIQ